tara:strand:+ start:225 stop:518 length:294 start_codon:yes stop_codon:yes gene_type:complete
MRKITETIANAFAQGTNKAQGNTVTVDGKVYLHGNEIVKRDSDGLYMSLAGWNTTTTRERLNGIAQVLGLDVSFNQKAFEPYLNGKLIDASNWYKVN